LVKFGTSPRLGARAFDAKSPIVTAPTAPCLHVKASLAAILFVFGFSAVPVSADDASSSAASPTETIVVTARVSDEKLAQQVQQALRSDPYIDDSHITVSVRNGVVTLEGIVLDHSDLLAALRISGRISGVKALVDDLQLHRIGDD
jgi:hypothetical protein